MPSIGPSPHEDSFMLISPRLHARPPRLSDAKFRRTCSVFMMMSFALFGPDERLRLRIAMVKVAYDNRLEFCDAGDCQTLQLLVRQLAEEPLHHVEPVGTKCR